jgi:hypothetical protein
MTSDGRGLVLKAGESMRVQVRDEKNQPQNLDVRVLKVQRTSLLAGFPNDVPPADSDFLAVTLKFQPTGSLPVTIDSSQFYIHASMSASGSHAGGPPMVLGAARPGQPPEPDLPVTASVATARDLRFASVDAGEGAAALYLMNGAAFEFTDPAQHEVRTFVFPISRAMKSEGDYVRLMVDAKPASAAAPAGKAAPPASKAAPTASKAAPAAATPTATKR